MLTNKEQSQWRLGFLCAGIILGMWSVRFAYGYEGASFTNDRAALRLSGQYEYVFSNGTPRETNNYRFSVITSLNGWSISVTNANKPQEWGLMWCDQTNIFTLATDAINGYKIYGYAFSGDFYVPEAALDSVKLFFPWMVFCLKPQMIKSFENRGVIDIPPPWGRRYSLRDYGFMWKTRYFQDAPIIQSIEVIRDSELDLKSEEQELRRASINYPFEYSSREHRGDMLRSRKEIPYGFVRATYECKCICKTNAWVFPLTATFSQYSPTFNSSRPIRLVFEMELQVGDIEIIQNSEVSPMVSPAEAYVSDYRYQVANSRTKFNFATYSLKAGETFRSDNDPTLLAQAQEWLDHGPGYDKVQRRRFLVLVGMLGPTVVAIGMAGFWLRKKQTNKQHRKHP